MQGSTLRVGQLELRIARKIGEGGYSFVFLAEDVNNPNNRYALKRCVAADTDAMNNIEEEIRVMKILSGLNHPNLLQYICHTTKPGPNNTKEYYIITEYCNGGSLIGEIQSCLDRGVLFPEQRMVKVLHQVFSGLHAMHTLPQPLAHRDIKLENVLIDAKGNYKLCDFGSTSTFSGYIESREQMQREEYIIEKRSTEMYRAPELCDLYRAKNNSWFIGPKVDIWAVGNILYTLAYHTHPFEDGGHMAILSGRIRFPDLKQKPEFQKYTPFVNYIISKCFTMNPNNRGDAKMMMYLTQCWGQYLQTKQHSDNKIAQEIATWVPRVITDANIHVTTETLAAQQNQTQQGQSNSNPHAARRAGGGGGGGAGTDLQAELRRLEQEALAKIAAEQRGALATAPHGTPQSAHHRSLQQQRGNAVPGGQAFVRRPMQGQQQQQQPQQGMTRQTSTRGVGVGGVVATPSRINQNTNTNNTNNNNNNNADDWGDAQFDVDFDNDDFFGTTTTTTTNTTTAPTPSQQQQQNIPRRGANTPLQGAVSNNTSANNILFPKLPSVTPSSSTTRNNNNNNNTSLQQPSFSQQNSSTMVNNKTNTNNNKVPTFDDWGDFGDFDTFISDTPTNNNNTNNNNNNIAQSTTTTNASTNVSAAGGDIFESFGDLLLTPQPSSQQQQQPTMSRQATSQNQNNMNNISIATNNNNNTNINSTNDDVLDAFSRLSLAGSTKTPISPQHPQQQMSLQQQQPSLQQQHSSSSAFGPAATAMFFSPAPAATQQQVYNPYLTAAPPRNVPATQKQDAQPDFFGF